MGDFLSDLGSAISSAAQQIEQGVEKDVGSMMGNVMGGGSNPASTKGADGSNSMESFSLAGMFGANGNGFAGELIGNILGNEFGIFGSSSGILGGIFASHSQPPSASDGYAVAPPPPGNTDAGTHAASAPDSCATGNTSGTHSASAPNGDAKINLDPRTDQEIAALETLMANFDKISKDGTLSYADLQKLSFDSSNPELQKAAKFFVQNGDLYDQLQDRSRDDALPTWDSMSRVDQRLNRDKAASSGDQQQSVGTGSTGGSTVVGPPPGRDPADIKSDAKKTPKSDPNKTPRANGSSGEKQGSTGTGKSGDTGKTGSTGQTDRTGNTGSTGGNTGEFGKAMDTVDANIASLEQQINESPDSNTVQKLQAQLKDLYLDKQTLAELEQQLFQMKSEMSKLYHDMCMTAIRNING